MIADYVAASIEAARYAYSPAGLAAVAVMPGVWLAIALQACDVATTIVGLRRGGREANGLLREIMAELGRAWPIVKLAILPALPALALWLPAVWTVNAIMAWIVSNNLRVISRL